jgi:hypothetical protein
MRSNIGPTALALAIVAATLCAACSPGKYFSSMTRKEVLATQLHVGKYNLEIDDAIESGKLTPEESELLRGFHTRYATEPFYAGKFPDGITVRSAIKDERKFIHDADPRPHGPFVDNDNGE